MRSFSSGSASASCRPVARKTCICSSLKPGLDAERVQVLPVPGGLADLLRELALRRVHGRLALDVELAGGQLEQVGLADRPRAAGAPSTRGSSSHATIAYGAGMADDLAVDDLAVLVAEAVLAHRRDTALPDRPRADPLEAAAHARSRSASSASAEPPASADAKNSSSSSIVRPIVLRRQPGLARSRRCRASRGGRSCCAGIRVGAVGQRDARPARAAARARSRCGGRARGGVGAGRRGHARDASPSSRPSASAAWAVSSAAIPPWPSAEAEPRMPGPGPHERDVPPRRAAACSAPAS